MPVREWTPAGPWLIATAVVSIGLVLGAPLLGQIQVALRGWTGPYYVLVVTSLAGATMAAGLAGAVARVRDRRSLRYGGLALSAAIGAAYFVTMRSGDAAVDVVESIHFLQYGLVAVLAYHAFHASHDAAAMVVPVLIGLLVAFADEWVQWFVPARVGEVRDVALNLVAVVCGVLVGASMTPPRTVTARVARVSRRWMGGVAIAVLLSAAGFVHSVHLGHEIADPDAGVFRSRYHARQLDEVSAQRRARWAADPPLAWSRFSREDQYFTEAMAHVRHRNRLWEGGDISGAWQENRILERYYAPALDAPSWLSSVGHRWPSAQRADAEVRRRTSGTARPSEALDYPVLIWPWWVVWSVAVLGSWLILRGVGRAD